MRLGFRLNGSLFLNFMNMILLDQGIRSKTCSSCSLIMEWGIRWLIGYHLKPLKSAASTWRTWYRGTFGRSAIDRVDRHSLRRFMLPISFEGWYWSYSHWLLRRSLRKATLVVWHMEQVHKRNVQRQTKRSEARWVVTRLREKLRIKRTQWTRRPNRFSCLAPEIEHCMRTASWNHSQITAKRWS